MSSSISLGQLVREVANSDATNKDAQRDLLGKLYEIKASARDLQNPELEFLLDAAADMLRYLADGAQPSLQAMLTMVTRMVVNAECLMYRGLEIVDDPSAESATQSSSAPQMRTLPAADSPSRTLSLDKSGVVGLPPALPANPQESPIPVKSTGGMALRLDPTVSTVTSSKDLNGMRIGQVLVELGLIGEAQIKEALDLQQKQEGSRLGEALLRLGYVMPDGLKEALALQKKMREFATDPSQSAAWDTGKVGVGEWQESLLGALLVQRQIVDEDQLKKALSISRATGMRLGEALVHHGFCDWATVREVINDQERMRHQTGGGKSIPLLPGGGTWQA